MEIVKPRNETKSLGYSPSTSPAPPDPMKRNKRVPRKFKLEDDDGEDAEMTKISFSIFPGE
jgi:hypothetical protein